MALAFGLSLGFATLGCASREVTDWAPLAVGHRWAYREINRVDPARPQMDTIYLEVLKADPNFENGYSVRRSAGAGRTRTEMEIWFKKFDPQGYSFWLSDPNLSYVLCVLMVPPERGGWRLEGREDGAYCLYKGLRSVTVPAGLFHRCMLITVEYPLRGSALLQRERYWFARNVGMVQYAKYLNGRAIYKLELLRFEPGTVPAAPRREGK